MNETKEQWNGYQCQKCQTENIHHSQGEDQNELSQEVYLAKVGHKQFFMQRQKLLVQHRDPEKPRRKHQVTMQ